MINTVLNIHLIHFNNKVSEEGGFVQETFVFIGIDKLGSQARRKQ